MTQMDRNIRTLIFMVSASISVFLGYLIAKGIHSLVM